MGWRMAIPWAKAEAARGRGVFARKVFTQPLFDQHPKGRSNKADDKAREPQYIHSDVFVGDLERRGQGGKDIGSNERAVCKIHSVSSCLCGDTFDRMNYPI